MLRNSNRMLVLVPALLALTVVTTSFIDKESILIELCQAPELTSRSAHCAVVAKTLDWADWLSGSSSTQFHFIDLLELITPSSQKK